MLCRTLQHMVDRMHMVPRRFPVWFPVGSPYGTIIWFHTGSIKNVLSYIIARIRGYRCLQSARYKFCNLTSFIRLRRKIKNINNISLKFIMLPDNNQIFRNWFVIIHRHLTKISAEIIQCIIFERNGLSITLSTLWSDCVDCRGTITTLWSDCVDCRGTITTLWSDCVDCRGTII